jgi:hypothetical protein
MVKKNFEPLLCINNINFDEKNVLIFLHKNNSKKCKEGRSGRSVKKKKKLIVILM